MSGDLTGLCLYIYNVVPLDPLAAAKGPFVNYVTHLMDSPRVMTGHRHIVGGKGSLKHSKRCFIIYEQPLSGLS